MIETGLTPTRLPRHRRTGWNAIAALGSLGIGVAAVLGVQAATTPVTVTGHASSGQGGSLPAGFVPGYRHGGPFDGAGSARGGSGSPSSTGTTTASAAQQVGVVEVVTVLQYRKAQAAGTGMILTSHGEILTNNHVVDGATSISVTIASTGATYAATVVGTDPTDDVAVLQLADASGLQTAKLSSSAAAVGESITGVGNAGGTGTRSPPPTDPSPRSTSRSPPPTRPAGTPSSCPG